MISDQKTEGHLNFQLLCVLIGFILILNPQSAFAKSKVKKVKAAQVKQEQIKKEEPQKPISADVIDALARGNLNEAAIELREQPTTAKSLYLLREVTRIVMHETSKKHPKHSEAHQYYQNLGIAYHNLFLFLKANGITQEQFAENSVKFYKKAGGSATPQHKQETDLLMAAVFASNNEPDKADKVMKKVDLTKLGADFQTQEYLAAYYAARGDQDDAMESLKAAYRERPDVIMTWLAVGDDFYIIKDDPRFVALLSDWHFAKSSKQLNLKLPPPAAPKLQFAEPKVQFRHPTAPQAQPHYRLPKNKKSYAALSKSKSKGKASAKAKYKSTKTTKKKSAAKKSKGK